MGKTSCKEAYIDYDEISNVKHDKETTDLIESIFSKEISILAAKYINMIALGKRMYPASPFEALTYCFLRDIRCVVIGGMPDRERIEKWTGSAFSYDDNRPPTELHKKLIHDVSVSYNYTPPLEANLLSLQMDGVLLLHEVLSYAEGYGEILKCLWEPIIFQILQKISSYNSDVPIVFTSKSAMDTFYDATIESKTKFCLKMGSDGTSSSKTNTKIFDMVEEIVNDGVDMKMRLNFLTLIKK